MRQRREEAVGHQLQTRVLVRVDTETLLEAYFRFVCQQHMLKP